MTRGGPLPFWDRRVWRAPQQTTARFYPTVSRTNDTRTNHRIHSCRRLLEGVHVLGEKGLWAGRVLCFQRNFCKAMQRVLPSILFISERPHQAVLPHNTCLLLRVLFVGMC